ncbi:MAG: hypothetical protein M3Q13_07405 [Pseudomonadota bacterium]|nr:hypothetical protein [Pseudomonadota bacterium]
MPPAPLKGDRRTRNRGMLIALIVIFLGSFIVAGALRFSGWRPDAMKNKGELLQPPGDLRNARPVLADGSEYSWKPAERIWRIALAPPENCTSECVELARQLDLVWRLFGRQADRVHVLWIGAPITGAIPLPTQRLLRSSPSLRAGLPRVDDAKGVPVYVIDPNGFVILRYAPGFDPADLRTDMARLLKLR